MCSVVLGFCDVMGSVELDVSPPVSGVLLFFGDGGICILGSASFSCRPNWGGTFRDRTRTLSVKVVSAGVRGPESCLFVCVFVCSCVCPVPLPVSVWLFVCPVPRFGKRGCLSFCLLCVCL